jgi:NAD(P)-dependent dehydrogenase (short-subunit alcohol dehydrogenase family)
MSERTVLVTGATGLLGREVSAAFGLKNWTVKGTGYSRADGINTFKVDLGNEAEVASFLDETKFEPLPSNAAASPQANLNGLMHLDHRS